MNLVLSLSLFKITHCVNIKILFLLLYIILQCLTVHLHRIAARHTHTQKLNCFMFLESAYLKKKIKRKKKEKNQHILISTQYLEKKNPNLFLLEPVRFLIFHLFNTTGNCYCFL